MVDLKAEKLLKKPITLQDIKKNIYLTEMVLVKNSRLSVQPVTVTEWGIIASMYEQV